MSFRAQQNQSMQTHACMAGSVHKWDVHIRQGLAKTAFCTLLGPISGRLRGH